MPSVRRQGRQAFLTFDEYSYAFAVQLIRPRPFAFAAFPSRRLQVRSPYLRSGHLLRSSESVRVQRRSGQVNCHVVYSSFDRFTPRRYRDRAASLSVRLQVRNEQVQGTERAQYVERVYALDQLRC